MTAPEEIQAMLDAQREADRRRAWIDVATAYVRNADRVAIVPKGDNTSVTEQIADEAAEVASYVLEYFDEEFTSAPTERAPAMSGEDEGPEDDE